MNPIPHALLAAAVLLGCPATGYAAGRPVALIGSAQDAKGISGVRGQAVTLAADKPGHAAYGLFSVERRDHPCYLALRTENVNDIADRDGAIRDFCGDRATSRELGVAFEDRMAAGPRVFMTGIRVCMNGPDSRVKGLQIRGRRIGDDGTLVELDADPAPIPGSAGNRRTAVVVEPRDERPNCTRDGWQRWVECPQRDQVVTAIVAHFDARTAPRNLTGLGLECRQVGIAAAAR